MAQLLALISLIFYLYSIQCFGDTCHALLQADLTAPFEIEVARSQIFIKPSQYSVEHSQVHFLKNNQSYNSAARDLKSEGGYQSTTLFPPGVTLEQIKSLLKANGATVFIPDKRLQKAIETLGLELALNSMEAIGLETTLMPDSPHSLKIRVVICAAGPCQLPDGGRLEFGDIITIYPLRGNGVIEIKKSASGENKIRRLPLK